MDPLHFWPINKWEESQRAFKADWPRGIPGFTVLEHQREWLDKGLDYGFKVYVPYGDVWNGIVGINEKTGDEQEQTSKIYHLNLLDSEPAEQPSTIEKQTPESEVTSTIDAKDCNTNYEIVIQCPKDDTTKLAEALRTTKLIDWDKLITLPFAPKHIADCVKSILADLNLEIKFQIPSLSFYMDKDTPLFEDVSLPAGVTFDILTEDHVDILDEHWPHRYPGSSWYFDLLIKTKCGYGLFLNGELTSWMLINEFGVLTHVFTLEQHRKKGYSEKLLKIVCNIQLKEHKHVFAFCVADNVIASNLYNKVGFSNYNEYEVAWYWLKRKEK